MFFTPFSKQGPGSICGACHLIHMKPINITRRFQTVENKNRYLTGNWINSSSTEPLRAITHMHLNVIAPHALQTAKLYYTCNSIIFAPIRTSPKCLCHPHCPHFHRKPVNIANLHAKSVLLSKVLWCSFCLQNVSYVIIMLEEKVEFWFVVSTMYFKIKNTYFSTF